MKHGVKMKMLMLVALLASTLGSDLHEPEGFDLTEFVSASPILSIASDTTVARAGSTTNSAMRIDESCYCDQEMCCNQDGPCRCMYIHNLLAAIERNKR